MAAADAQIGASKDDELQCRAQATENDDHASDCIHKITAVKPLADVDTAASAAVEQPLFSALTDRQKQMTVYLVSFVAVLSPLASTTYYPALTTLAADFQVSQSLMQLTITVYQIFQGIAPSFIANYSDSYGRKPAYAICFIIFIAANVGLALQHSYAGLMVLRCVQSSGSSVTVPLAAGAVADISTPAERGKYISYASLGVALGPALGLIVGGLLNQYLGWRWIFWFLAIFTGALAPIYFLFVPETARCVVGNGSIPPPRLSMTSFQLTKRKSNKVRPEAQAQWKAERAILKANRKPLNPLAATKILGEKEGGMTLGFSALVYGGYFMVLTTFPVELAKRFGYSPVTVGVCYLPVFIGSIFSRSIAGFLLDRNFRRHAKRLGIEITKGKQPDLEKIPIEAARLQISIPMIYATSLFVVAYGWVMQTKSSLAGIEVCLFFLGLFTNGGLSGLNTLVVDTHQESPATAMAANNLFRCLVSAGAVAIATPLINKIGIGWTSVFISGVWLFFSPCLWLVLIYGAQWRQEKQAKLDKA